MFVAKNQINQLKMKRTGLLVPVLVSELVGAG